MKKIFICFLTAFAVFFANPAIAQEPIPGIVSLSENSGSADGGNIIVATGVNFSELTTVTVNGQNADVEYVDSSSIKITMPSGEEGVARIFVTNDGLVSTESMGSYEYVAPPPPPATPDPTPTPAPDPDPISNSQPSPAPGPQPAAVPSSTAPIEEFVEQQVVEEQPVTEPTFQTTNINYLSDSAFILYSESGTENLVVQTEHDVLQKFVLRKRVDDEWIYIDKSYQFDGNVVFLDTDLELGYTYKVIVEIDGKKTIVAWFDVLSKQYTVV